MIGTDDVDGPADDVMEMDLGEPGWRIAMGRVYYFLYHDSIRSFIRNHPAAFARALTDLYSRRRADFDPDRVAALDLARAEMMPMGLHSEIPRFLRRPGYGTEAGRFVDPKCVRAVADCRLGQLPGRERALEWMQEMRDLARRIREI